MGTVILDSNVILKYLEGTTDIRGILAQHNCTYNDIIVSEVEYLVIRSTTNRGPFEIKRMKEFPLETRTALRTVYEVFDHLLEYVPIGRDVILEARKYMERYALLPNDAIILATATYYDMDGLLTYDSDLLKIEKAKGVRITTPEEFVHGTKI